MTVKQLPGKTERLGTSRLKPENLLTIPRADSKSRTSGYDAVTSLRAAHWLVHESSLPITAVTPATKNQPVLPQRIPGNAAHPGGRRNVSLVRAKNPAVDRARILAPKSICRQRNDGPYRPAVKERFFLGVCHPPPHSVTRRLSHGGGGDFLELKNAP
ncbi:MAG: hypothetical protein M1157_01810, partial [Deinococcus sp.]|nr:hypothetical protein [Deinococcus sp.]